MKVVPKQGHATVSSQTAGHREPRPYAINPNFPSQLGSAIDPRARERMSAGEGFVPAVGTTDGMDQGPGANRTVKTHGTQGSH